MPFSVKATSGEVGRIQIGPSNDTYTVVSEHSLFRFHVSGCRKINQQRV